MPLVVAGDGPEAAGLRAGAPGVRFTGRVEPAELAELRAGAALALVPSRYEEILPLAALEAMAAGLPVVASRAGGLAELVPEPGLHPPGDVAAMADRIRALLARRRRRRGSARDRPRAHRPAGRRRRAAGGLRSTLSGGPFIGVERRLAQPLVRHQARS